MTEDFFTIRERLRKTYIAPKAQTARAEVLSDGGFLTEVAGRVILTAPAHTIRVADELPKELAERWEQAARGNPFMMWLQGRYVEAEKANRNGAFWSTEDLQFGEMTVKHGPLNWLHEEQTIIGTIADNAIIRPQAESMLPNVAALQPFTSGGHTFIYNAPTATWTSSTTSTVLADEQLWTFAALNSNGQMPMEMPKITDRQSMAAAIAQCRKAGNPPAMKNFIMGKARAMNMMDMIPKDWTSAKADLLDPMARPYMAAVSAVWKWVHPDKVKQIEAAAAQGRLYYSMECIAREMTCVSDETHEGCGASFDYVTAMTQPHKTCEHIQSRSSARRLVDPSFLGGAVIVPPTQPGWGSANVELIRASAKLAEQTEAASMGMSATQWESLMSGVLRFAGA